MDCINTNIQKKKKLKQINVYKTKLKEEMDFNWSMPLFEQKKYIYIYIRMSAWF